MSQLIIVGARELVEPVLQAYGLTYRPGDTRLNYSVETGDGIATAERVFTDLLQQHFVAFARFQQTGEDIPVTSFQPFANRVILLAETVGG